VIGPRLEELYGSMDVAARLHHDPVAFPRRYADPADIEVAAAVAASLAFGRVDLFRPVLARLFVEMDARGGPRRYVEGFDRERDGAALLPIVYRWTRGPDFVALFAVLGEAVRQHGGLEPLFDYRGEPDVREALQRGIDALRAIASAQAGRPFGELSRGVKGFFPAPDGGSACKRWNMFLRWVVRPGKEGVDLGIWRRIPTRALVVPLDTHVARIARFVGLTARTDGSWKTAIEITRSLRDLDADDPIRFDFAIAHLGISGACKGRWDAEVCPACPLVSICVEATAAGG
jgi:uncharacterized protein (TIGR02757 family)